MIAHFERVLRKIMPVGDDSGTEWVDEDWADAESRIAMEEAVRNGMPPRALGVFARWWQLETWLRDLAYVELRARYGREWEGILKAGLGRQAQDLTFGHMVNSSSSNILGYLDYSQLIRVISDHWDLFEKALIHRSAWDGRQEELKRIRHRVGHVRWPHSDDLHRLEQTLRDLEQGAFMAFASYNRRFMPMGTADAVTAGWMNRQHPKAKRLVDHAEERYGTRLILEASRRPWATAQQVDDPAPGLLWHASFTLRSRSVGIFELWREIVARGMDSILVHLVANDQKHVEFTFSAADSGDEISDAIGYALETVLAVSRLSLPEAPDYQQWQSRARSVDFRVISGSGWNIVDDSTLPITNFGAGGGVGRIPAW
ncbi:hypothetical protein DFJ68_0062 [Terracoccus luteus]|uniref:Uncharacterized protein n=1 Tax=Terracoccus luteus TaxID=53356 RepID=A0A495XV20_9MICO|nr:hypothetical protein [Terracoccus luteus]RKT76666.1 hypothetical protein DFJ68_0062 [Terracoccus luteus]